MSEFNRGVEIDVTNTAIRYNTTNQRIVLINYKKQKCWKNNKTKSTLLQAKKRLCSALTCPQIVMATRKTSTRDIFSAMCWSPHLDSCNSVWEWTHGRTRKGRSSATLAGMTMRLPCMVTFCNLSLSWEPQSVPYHALSFCLSASCASFSSSIWSFASVLESLWLAPKFGSCALVAWFGDSALERSQ